MTNKAAERIWQYRADPLNEMHGGVEYIRADIHDEAHLASLAHQGQAQDAYEAQRQAEAEVKRLQSRINYLEEINRQSEKMREAAIRLAYPDSFKKGS